MRWSKLRALILERFAGTLAKRLDIHSAAYGDCSCGHAWVTLDGEMIANFCTRAHFIAQGWESSDSKPNPMYKAQLTARGEFSRQDAYRSCWAFIHELSIEQALASDDPLVQMLAVADARVGRRRLQTLDPDTLHPLVGFVVMLRLDPESCLTPGEFMEARRTSSRPLVERTLNHAASTA